MIAALHLSPDAAIVLFTVGILLIFVELNRPGVVLPGCLGLLATLFAIAAVLPTHPPFVSLALISIGTLLLALQLWVRMPYIFAALCIFPLVMGLHLLAPHPTNPSTHMLISLLCGLILGLSSTYLAQIARHARANKGLDLK